MRLNYNIKRIIIPVELEHFSVIRCQSSVKASISSSEMIHLMTSVNQSETFEHRNEHTEKSILNLINSYQNLIVIALFRSIWNTDRIPFNKSLKTVNYNPNCNESRKDETYVYSCKK